MSGEYFYITKELEHYNSNLINQLREISLARKIQIFVLRSPLSDIKYKYNVERAFAVLVPKHKVILINEGESSSNFEDYKLDFIEDLGSISDKFNYRKILGRVRDWRDELIHIEEISSTPLTLVDTGNIINSAALLDPASQKRGDLLISLLSGSINDIERIGKEVPDNLLDKVKKKIQLFDGEQTKFIFSEPDSKRITIQGLSGTGKTELLLHRLKEIYVNEPQSKIIFTCHNKILASSLRKRIPVFFNFMRVEQQIEWNERLWCVHAWGSSDDVDSGTLIKICRHYGVPFRRYNPGQSFETVCKETLKDLGKLYPNGIKPFFDYIFVDESQDFPVSFFELCELVSLKTVYVAGDIFQSIFDENIVSEVEPDFLLSKCYRTDPKTLMFAHALGMGLFETKKLRWLKDEEWKACGYKVKKEKEKYFLARDPLRRFEDVSLTGHASVEIIKSKTNDTNNDTASKVVEIIDTILNENPSAKPEDIGITFSGVSKHLYNIADRIGFIVQQKYDWEINKAYNSKTNKDSTLFISNKNNVKGLEFPFLICFSDGISDAPHERNALYMLMTRSFIKSYLVISDKAESLKIQQLEQGLKSLLDVGVLVLDKPRPEDILSINTSIKHKNNLSINDMAKIVFDEHGVNEEFRLGILQLLHASKSKYKDQQSIRDYIEKNLEELYS